MSLTEANIEFRSALLYILNQASAQGHMYLPQEILTARAQELLGIRVEDMSKYLMDLAIDRKIVLKERELPNQKKQKLVYAGQYYYLELNCARMLHELNVICEEDRESVRRQLEQIEKSAGTELDEVQREAVVEAACSGLNGHRRSRHGKNHDDQCDDPLFRGGGAGYFSGGAHRPRGKADDRNHRL